MPMCAKFIGSWATHSSRGQIHKTSLHGKQRQAVTNSQLWTTMVAPGHRHSRCSRRRTPTDKPLIRAKICVEIVAAVLCNSQSHHVSPIHIATRASIPRRRDSHRLRCRAKSTTARGSDCGAGSASRDRGCRLREDAHAYLSRGLPARKRDRSSQYPASHFHEQGCAPNAGPCREFATSRCQRALGWHIPFDRKSDLASTRQCTRLLEWFHHLGPRRSKAFDQCRRNQRRNRSEGDSIPER